MRNLLLAVVACFVLFFASDAEADNNLRLRSLQSRLSVVSGRNNVQAVRQAQFIQNQQLAALNALNVHNQLAQLRVIQQQQFVQPLVVQPQAVFAPPVVLQSTLHPQFIRSNASFSRIRSCR